MRQGEAGRQGGELVYGDAHSEGFRGGVLHCQWQRGDGVCTQFREPGSHLTDDHMVGVVQGGGAAEGGGARVVRVRRAASLGVREGGRAGQGVGAGVAGVAARAVRALASVMAASASRACRVRRRCGGSAPQRSWRRRELGEPARGVWAGVCGVPSPEGAARRVRYRPYSTLVRRRRVRQWGWGQLRCFSGQLSRGPVFGGRLRWGGWWGRLRVGRTRVGGGVPRSGSRPLIDVCAARRGCGGRPRRERRREGA